ncbi:MAG: helix-turn-helix transcriptional regulator [Phycisphaeraceae bacterium]|nr:helix-turn-helix transcriptional regulator [Phycisphaeraceae bacterium]
MRYEHRFLTLDEISPTVHMAACFRRQKIFWHRYRIPSHHILLLESGQYRAKTPNGTFVAQPGDLLCFRPTDWNESGNPVPCVVYESHLEFAPPPRQGWTPNLNELGPLPLQVSLGDAFADMRRVFEVLCMEVEQDTALATLRTRAAVHEMLAIIVSVLNKKQEQSLKHLDPWLRLRLRLDSELGGELKGDVLAKEMHLSRAYFIRTFKQRFGLTPKAYHTQARLREAARLLRSTDKPIKAIAYELGFADPRIFTRLFKSHLSVLPSDVRLGVAPPLEESPAETDQLFPLNRHLVPPRAGSNWMQRYLPRHRKPDFIMTLGEVPPARD